jgi:Flp pilus assembly protein TadD
LSDTSDSPLARAVAALAQGDLPTALTTASDACHDEPGRPEPHYVYGQVWLAMDQPARAEPAFATAVGLRPDWPDAWINYGLARYRQGFLEDAKTAMRQALMRAPGHPAALANLGAFMRISGQPFEAEALLRASIAAEPGNVAARLNLAADLLQEERSEEALALLGEADPPAGDPPALRHWLLQQSLALIQLGNSGAAGDVMAALEALGPIPPALAPLWRWRRTLMAMLGGDRAAAQREAILMEQALGEMGPQAVLEHQIMARFDLAKFWSMHGQHPRAFRQWSEGHGLLARLQPFSRADHLRFVDANIARFDHARFAGARAANDDPAPVFVVGMPRSGTTLCEQILAAHRDVHGAGERTALGSAFAGLGGGGASAETVEKIAALDQASLDRAADGYLADLHALAPDRRRIVDKLPLNFLHLGLVGLTLPGARIIHCERDPRDIGLSIFTFRFHGSHPYAHDLADLGWTIAQQVRLMDHWKATLPNPILTVRLSDWIEDFDGTLARVLAFLELEPDEACARFYEQDSRVRTVSRAQVRQPINARGLGRWKLYADELEPMIAELRSAGVLQG